MRRCRASRILCRLVTDILGHRHVIMCGAVLLVLWRHTPCSSSEDAGRTGRPVPSSCDQYNGSYTPTPVHLGIQDHCTQ